MNRSEILARAPDEADLEAYCDRMAEWRHEIHAHPELAFQEHRTAAFVAARLREAGLEVQEGLGGTGVLGTLRAGTSGRSVLFRCELDALPIEEATGRPWASRIPGVMHACGHDGHCAMLLGAAAWLAANGGFDGTVYFLFQPAEENEGGARVLLEEGLLERISPEAVFALHTEPSLPIGHFSVAPGAVMASMDLFEVTVHGTASHAARPHEGADAIVAAAALVDALQTVRSRALDPLEPGVVSVTSIEGGATRNVLPDRVELKGTARLFSAAASRDVEAAVGRIAEGIAVAHGCASEVTWERRYPVSVNAEGPTSVARAVASAVAGSSRVGSAPFPLPASEDFAFLLRERPGSLVLLGNGESSGVHTPHFDFSDDALPWGLRYWATLARTLLPISAAAS